MTKLFGAESTTDQVLEGIDLSGRRILVTGVSAGLGVETARVLVVLSMPSPEARRTHIPRCRT